MDLLIR